MPERPMERRRHVMFITRNSEYHCRDRECVAVRDRNTGQWHRHHPAIRAELIGGVLNGKPTRRVPREGYRLVFDKEGVVLTSRVVSRARPQKDVLFWYTSLCRAGEINA